MKEPLVFEKVIGLKRREMLDRESLVERKFDAASNLG